MMLKKAFFLIFPLLLIFLFTRSILAGDDIDKVNDLQNQINDITAKLSEVRNKAVSLASQISYMDNQIKLASLKILETGEQIKEAEEDIKALEEKIGRLENSLTKVSEVLIKRIAATYKTGQVSPLLLLLSANGLEDALSRAKYLSLVQSHDKKLMFEIQSTKSDFEEEKKLLEDKKKQLDALKIKLNAQKISLDQQKKDKEYLLIITKNDEKRYQDLLSAAKAELEAIQAIIAGKGEETEVGKISEGQRIASIIRGPSCNSSGGHLHFMVVEGNEVRNPFSYLKSGIDYENCSGSSCGSGDNDLFNPTGSWNWPINPKVQFNQGYGNTWAAAHIPWLPYSFHNGIDINSSSSEVKAVKNGILHRGSYTGINGCRLRYVRVDHDDSDVNTYYLHINY